jgi:alpha-galactosidase
MTQLTLWSLIAAPLFLSCDLTRLDAFTVDLLTNDEVLDVDQDPLGSAAGRRATEGMTEVWSRPLCDGTLAVGLFNRGVFARAVSARWSDLGLSGPKPVRDLWQQKDLGRFDKVFTRSVPAHGAMLFKIGKPKAASYDPSKAP